MLAKAKKPIPRGRNGGRKPMPAGTARVFLSSSRVAPETAKALKNSGLPLGQTLDLWAQRLSEKEK